MSIHAVPTVKIKSDVPEHKGFLVINAADFDAEKHERFSEPPAPLPPPPAPPAAPGIPDPLAALPANWRDKDAGELRKLAEVVSGGRAVENKKQAIEVIEAALKARGK